MAESNRALAFAGKPVARGGFSWAPLGTALPTDASTPLVAAYIRGGLASEDGFSFTPDISSDEKKAWGGEVIDDLQTGFAITCKITLLQFLDPDVEKLTWGDQNVTVTPATLTTGQQIMTAINELERDHMVFAVDAFYRKSKLRYAIEDGKVTEVAEVKIVDSDFAGYELTIKAYKGTVTGNHITRYTDDGIFKEA